MHIETKQHGNSWQLRTTEVSGVGNKTLTYTITLVISPYRNGSKVVYNFIYKYDGDETTGKFKYSQADVDATKKAIADFAND
jgi:hypothetical protein